MVEDDLSLFVVAELNSDCTPQSLSEFEDAVVRGYAFGGYRVSNNFGDGGVVAPGGSGLCCPVVHFYYKEFD